LEETVGTRTTRKPVPRLRWPGMVR
jgi:hypothetical protein